MREQQVDSAVAGEQPLHSDRADERRQDHRHLDGGEPRPFAGEVEFFSQEREWDGDDQAQQGAAARQRDTVPQTVPVQLIFEHRAKRIECEMPVVALKTRAYHRPNRREQCEAEPGNQEQRQSVCGQPTAHATGIVTSAPTADVGCAAPASDFRTRSASE
jgi:hypothetical protein